MAVFCEDNPSPVADNWKPIGVLYAWWEVLVVDLNMRARISESIGNEVPPKTLIDEVNQRRLTPLFRARTGSLLRSPLAGDHSRTPDPLAIRQP